MKPEQNTFVAASHPEADQRSLITTTRINITITEETQAQAAALLRDQITPNFSGLVRKLVAEAHAKAFPIKPLRRIKHSPK